MPIRRQSFSVHFRGNRSYYLAKLKYNIFHSVTKTQLKERTDRITERLKRTYEYSWVLPSWARINLDKPTWIKLLLLLWAESTPVRQMQYQNSSFRSLIIFVMLVFRWKQISSVLIHNWGNPADVLGRCLRPGDHGGEWCGFSGVWRWCGFVWSARRSRVAWWMCVRVLTVFDRSPA